MEFGKWELRDNGYTSYYFSKDSMIFPSSNAVDQGKLNTEENVRNIYRDLTTKNFVTKYNYFSLSLNPNRNGIIVSPGEAVIQGYHFYAKNTVEVKVPDNTHYDTSGRIESIQPIEQFTLGISLSYDAANHVTGDIVNKEYLVGESEILSGVYVAWFSDCQLECNYKNILVLGRAWVQKGAIVQDGTILDGERIIYHGFEADPFKDHRFEANTIEVEVHGHKTTKYDTLRDNMTQIHEPLYTYDSMHFPIELDRQDRTKPPSFVTDIQDYINHLPDWYVSKYGDYMTGALRFNNMSIDAKREFKRLGIIKDSIENEFSDSLFISPRTYGNLTIESFEKVELENVNYSVGGTIMSIVPGTYNTNTDWNEGYTGIHAALISQLNGETGLKLHYGTGGEQNKRNTTRIVHYNEKDDGLIYDKSHSENKSKFIIENTDENGRKSSINLKNGEIFIDSIVSPMNNQYEEMLDDGFKGDSYGSGIQLYVSGKTTNPVTNIDFRVDESKISIAEHKYKNHRTGTRGTLHTGRVDDNLHFELGLGINHDGSKNINNNNPYLILGNLNIHSNKVESLSNSVKQNTIEVLNTNNDELPFVRIKPRTYSEQYVAEELVQIGTSEYDDLIKNHAQDSTLNRIVMKRVGTKDDTSQAFTYFEQDFRVSKGESKVFNKMIPAIDNKDIITKKDDGTYLSPKYNEIAGIYSAGNIGASGKDWLSTGKSGESMEDNNDPYSDNAEWVRFTRFRYDLDKDQVNGGTYKGGHIYDDKGVNKGRKWGDSYNIEFNTQVANRRANQIIWRYKGSGNEDNTVCQDPNTLKNTPPVVLSYIHDNPNENAPKDENKKPQGTHTNYTNVDVDDNTGVFETWIDHAGVTQYNPTYKTRDFLLLENAGLVVSGDINNPSLFGDTLNTSNHLGVTIVGGRVYNSVYNDFAETFEKDNKEEIAKPGTLISLNPKTGKYVICEGYENRLVVGIQSNSYAYLAGGNRINKAQDVIELEDEYFTVAVSGKVWVNVIVDSDIEPGDMLTSSNEKGRATKSNNNSLGTIIGKALSKPKYFKEEKEYKVLVLVMTA